MNTVVLAGVFDAVGIVRVDAVDSDDAEAGAVVVGVEVGGDVAVACGAADYAALRYAVQN